MRWLKNADEIRLHNHITKYIGYSDLFEDIPEGANAIGYAPIFSIENEKPVFVRFEKI